MVAFSFHRSLYGLCEGHTGEGPNETLKDQFRVTPISPDIK